MRKMRKHSQKQRQKTISRRIKRQYLRRIFRQSHRVVLVKQGLLIPTTVMVLLIALRFLFTRLYHPKKIGVCLLRFLLRFLLPTFPMVVGFSVIVGSDCLLLNCDSERFLIVVSDKKITSCGWVQPGPHLCLCHVLRI